MAVEAGGYELTWTGGDVADVGEEVVGEACDCGGSLGLVGNSRGFGSAGEEDAGIKGSRRLKSMNYSLPVQTISVTAPLSSHPLKVLCMNPSK